MNLQSLVSSAELLAIAKDTPHDLCWKCGGTGRIPHFAHVANGVCFACGGSKHTQSCKGCKAIKAWREVQAHERLATLPREEIELIRKTVSDNMYPVVELSFTLPGNVLLKTREQRFLWPIIARLADERWGKYIPVCERCGRPCASQSTGEDGIWHRICNGTRILSNETQEWGDPNNRDICLQLASLKGDC